MTLHPKKIYLQNYQKGVKFLGVVIKQYRIYISNRTKGNFYKRLQFENELILETQELTEAHYLQILSTVNSYLGILRHYNTYNLRKKMLCETLSKEWKNEIVISKHYLKIGINKKTQNALFSFHKFLP